MKQSFLDSLIGLFQDQAEALVEAEDLAAWSLPSRTAITAIARPDTVMLWLDDHNMVSQATAGDPIEVEQDKEKINE